MRIVMPATKISPVNLTAQQSYQARGNPPSTLPASAISNCFPGLEFDFRNIWKNLFVGIELHEAGVGNRHWIVGITPGSDAAAAGLQPLDNLVEIDGKSVLGESDSPNQSFALEFCNSLADAVQKGIRGESVDCVFDREGTRVSATLPVRNIFDGAALSPDLAEPGAMTQSLCSPWQTDYRECGCFYWAASRPDFVNAETSPTGQTEGHSWMQTDRSSGAAYVPDTLGNGAGEIQYEDLYRRWEEVLRFVIEGKDE